MGLGFVGWFQGAGWLWVWLRPFGFGVGLMWSFLGVGIIYFRGLDWLLGGLPCGLCWYCVF